MEETNRDKEKKREARKRGTEGGTEDRGGHDPGYNGAARPRWDRIHASGVCGQWLRTKPRHEDGGAGKRSEEETGGYRR